MRSRQLVSTFSILSHSVLHSVPVLFGMCLALLLRSSFLLSTLYRTSSLLPCTVILVLDVVIVHGVFSSRYFSLSCLSRSGYLSSLRLIGALKPWGQHSILLRSGCRRRSRRIVVQKAQKLPFLAEMEHHSTAKADSIRKALQTVIFIVLPLSSKGLAAMIVFFDPRFRTFVRPFFCRTQSFLFRLFDFHALKDHSASF